MQRDGDGLLPLLPVWPAQLLGSRAGIANRDNALSQAEITEEVDVSSFVGKTRKPVPGRASPRVRLPRLTLRSPTRGEDLE